MEKTNVNPDVYIKTLPEDIRTDVSALDEIITTALKLPRTVWKGIFWGGTMQTILGYGDYVYERPKGKTVEWFKIGLAVQKNYISVYVNAVSGEQYVAEKYAGDLGKVKVGKSSISFRSLSDLNLSGFKKMLKEVK